MPTVARKVPSHDAIPNVDPVEPKRRARLAWQTARQREVLPVPILDRLWSEGLLAMGSAPPQVRAVMAHRSECLFALLIDRSKWIAHEPAQSPPASAEPHPRARAGRMPRWSRS
jgi:hypothetical protein